MGEQKRRCWGEPPPSLGSCCSRPPPLLSPLPLSHSATHPSGRSPSYSSMSSMRIASSASSSISCSPAWSVILLAACRCLPLPWRCCCCCCYEGRRSGRDAAVPALPAAAATSDCPSGRALPGRRPPVALAGEPERGREGGGGWHSDSAQRDSAQRERHSGGAARRARKARNSVGVSCVWVASIFTTT